MSKYRQLTAKQEKFAQLVAEGVPATEAYCASYNTSSPVDSPTVQANSSKTKRIPHVKRRIEELTEQIEAHKTSGARLSPQYIMDKLRREAENPKGTPTSRIRALELIGKGLGMFKDDVTVNMKEERSSSEIKEELAKVFAALSGAKQTTQPSAEMLAALGITDMDSDADEPLSDSESQIAAMLNNSDKEVN